MSSVNASPRKQLGQSLKCARCKKVHNHDARRPKVLPCQHSACTKCMTKCMRGNGIHCPICKKYSVLTGKGVPGLPDNHTVLSLLPLLERIDDEMLSCFVHEDQRISHACMDCHVLLCSTCLQTAVINIQHPQHNVQDVPSALALTEQACQQAIMELEKEKERLDVNSLERFMQQADAVKIRVIERASRCIEIVEQWEQAMLEAIDNAKEDYENNKHEYDENDVEEKVREVLEDVTSVQTELLDRSIRARKKDVSVLEEQPVEDISDKLLQCDVRENEDQIELTEEWELHLGQLHVPEGTAPRRHKDTIGEDNVFLIANVDDTEQDELYN